MCNSQHITEPGRKATTAKGRRAGHGGFTLVEMTVTMLAAGVLFLAVGTILSGFQKSWNQSYNRVYGEVVSDGYIARRIFERYVRRATIKKCYPDFTVGTAYNEVEVYYYSVPGSSPLDRYAKFFFNDGKLKLEIGQLVPGTFDHAGSGSTTQVVARHVTACYFTQEGICLSMYLTLDDGSTSNTITVTATRHSE